MSPLPACVYEPAVDLWHVCKGDGDDKFQPILCNTVPELPGEVGINMPGNRTHRQPTCIDCYRIWRLEDSNAA